MKIKKVYFDHYKAFTKFTVNLSDFDVLVGPNNSGKSTILGVFKILSEGIKKANARKAEMVDSHLGKRWGYRLDLDEIPVSLENVFTDYNEDCPAVVKFFTDGNKKLSLYFPEKGVCNMITEDAGMINTPASFKLNFPISIGFVPVLGPVEHREEIFQKEAARKALLTHRASRNFRNIWHHYPEGFEEFQEMIQCTWPGMNIKPPEILIDGNGKSILAMFCPEESVPREIYWAGFGFQVWCQMLTFMIQSKKSTIFIIDEPDIYLHSDLQRQLVNILCELGPQILIATHSIEIISEVESRSLLTIHKKRIRATRILNSGDIQNIYQQLGSNANPVLTQIAKTKRVLFLEGKDFQILSLFARKMKYFRIANRFDFAVVSVGGFSTQKTDDFSRGIEMTLGMPIARSIIFDRDYRSQQEVDEIKDKLAKKCEFIIIHDRKEIENFLLNPNVLDRSIKSEIKKNNLYTKSKNLAIRSSKEILMEICDELRPFVLSQYMSNYKRYIKISSPKLDESTVNIQIIKEFEEKWKTLDEKLKLVSGKEALSMFNNVLQNELKISLTQNIIINEFKLTDIDDDMKKIMEKLNKFIACKIPK